MSNHHQFVRAGKGCVLVGERGFALLDVLVSLTMLSLISLVVLRGALLQLKNIQRMKLEYRTLSEESAIASFDEQSGYWLYVSHSENAPRYTLVGPHE